MPVLRKLLLTVSLCLAVGPLHAQKAEAVQVHGYATQGIIFSTQDNYLTKRSSDGEFGWTEGVLSVTERPIPRLRIGVQFHYERLGVGGDRPTVDWVLADYQVNGYFGVRAGKVKTPVGLFNDSQDIDAVFLWSLLPQSTYTIDNRSFFLAHYGGEIYGSVTLGERLGKLNYRLYGGKNSLASDQGYAQQLSGLTGLQFNNAISGPVWGGDLRWEAPYRPLMLGVSLFAQHVTGTATMGSASLRALIPVYYAQFDKGRFYAAGEYRRQPNHGTIQIGPFSAPLQSDQRQWYAMTSFRPTEKLQIGSYYSHQTDGNLPRYQQGSVSKDLVFSSRYDFNPNIYAKAEDHFLHGTSIGFYQPDNPLGTKARTNVVIVKLGFYF